MDEENILTYLKKSQMTAGVFRVPHCLFFPHWGMEQEHTCVAGLILTSFFGFLKCFLGNTIQQVLI